MRIVQDSVTWMGREGFAGVSGGRFWGGRYHSPHAVKYHTFDSLPYWLWISGCRVSECRVMIVLILKGHGVAHFIDHVEDTYKGYDTYDI